MEVYSDDGDEYHPTPPQGTTRGRSSDEEAGATSPGEEMDKDYEEERVSKKASSSSNNTKQPQAKRPKNSIIVSVVQ